VYRWVLLSGRYWEPASSLFGPRYLRTITGRPRIQRTVFGNPIKARTIFGWPIRAVNGEQLFRSY
jgi:hypothetical protein